MASISWNPTSQDREPYVKPEEVYYGSTGSTSAPLKLRIATGGAGQSGLVRALADAFIDDQVKRTGCEPFSVGWLKSDTSASFNYLAQAAADLSITYHGVAEETAIAQGIADRRVYAWRDHFMLVGPKSNPAQLSTDGTTPIETLFTQLFRAAVASNNSIRFLTRFDKSATNIKESHVWAAIGQTPWSYPYSFWYHVVPMFPFQALEAAAKLGEYSLVDWGTWNGVQDFVRKEMIVYLLGKDDTPEMLNPARVLVGTHARNKEVANAFADWMIRDDGGQKVVEGFAINGVVLYSKAPKEGESAGRRMNRIHSRYDHDPGVKQLTSKPFIHNNESFTSCRFLDPASESLRLLETSTQINCPKPNSRTRRIKPLSDLSNCDMTTIQTDPRHGLRLIWQKELQRWLTRSSMDQIMPNLFLGGSYAAENLPGHNPNEINFVLTIMDYDLPDESLARLRSHGINQLHVSKRDERDENLLESFDELCAVIEAELQGGKKVLVHCAMGISRSATVVCAYLMQRFALPRSDAKQLVKSKRNVANPNSAFYTQLRIWGQCHYDLRAAISINGVKPFKQPYQDWLQEFELMKRERRERRERERAASEMG